MEDQLAFNSAPILLPAAASRFGAARLLEDHVTPCLPDGSLVRVLEDCCPPFAGHHLGQNSRNNRVAGCWSGQL
jgi:hypothetical protein